MLSANLDDASREGPPVPRPARAALPREDTTGSSAIEARSESRAARRRRRLGPCERAEGPRAEVESAEGFLDPGILYLNTTGDAERSEASPTERAGREGTRGSGEAAHFVRRLEGFRTVPLLPGVGGVALALDHLDVPFEKLLAGAVGGVDVLQQRLQALSRLVTQFSIAGLTDVFELLFLAGPAVAVLVVLAGRRAGDLLAAGDTGYFRRPASTTSTATAGRARRRSSNTSVSPAIENCVTSRDRAWRRC